MGENVVVEVGRLLEGAATASALARLLERGVDEPLAEDDPAAGLLGKAGLVEAAPGGYLLAGRDAVRGREAVVLANIRSSLGQAYAIATGGTGWAGHDDMVLEAQGVSSSAGGPAFAGLIASVPELKEAFAAGGTLVDVGVGVAALACEFCRAVPGSRVIGLDVLPRALELARRRVDAAGLADRVDLRLVAVEDLEDQEVADLAHLPTVFVPPSVLPEALRRLAAALKPGGWLVLSGVVADGPDGAGTRWMAHHAGGSAVTDADVAGLAERTGFGPPAAVPLPPGAPRVLLLRKAGQLG